MSLRAWIGVALAVVACAAYGCGTGGPEVVAQPMRPQPVLALAGQSYAQVAADWSSLPPGDDAAGRPGDVVLQNAFVRFVIAAGDRPDLPGARGSIVDAAVQGGEDRMRLLVPLLGEGRLQRPLYASVRVEEPGGLRTRAVAVAEGHLPGRPGVPVKTVYTLAPGSRALEIVTEVRNETGQAITGFTLGDALYHGRTLRFLPDAGLMPAGRKSASPWLAFFADGLCWGVLAGPLGTIEGVHQVGLSELRYGTVDILAGSKQRYTRRLMAAVGRPEQVWRASLRESDDELAPLSIEIVDNKGGGPVADAQVVFASEGGSPVLMVTDAAGRTEAQVPPGRYLVQAWAPGRPPVGPFGVDCAVGQISRQTLRLSAPARAAVRVQIGEGDLARPVPARVAAYQAARLDIPCPPPTPFPVAGWSGVAFADTRGRALLALSTAYSSASGACVIVATHGPLSSGAAVPAQSVPGQTTEVQMTLERVVDPGAYVAVDMRQHSRASPDCAVTLAERAAANACEGLQAAVVSDPGRGVRTPTLELAGRPPLIAGLRVEAADGAAFSVYPLSGGAGGGPDVRALRAADASGCLALLRQRFPEAVIQLDNPVDPDHGYFALSGFDPRLRRSLPEGLSADFDAIELLSRNGLDDVRLSMSHWFRLLNAGRRVFVTGSSGARDVMGAAGGAARTFLRCESEGADPTVSEVEAAIRALRSSPDAFVSNGPFIEATLEGQPIGSTLTAPAQQRVQMALRVYAPAWMDVRRVMVYRNGDVVKDFDLPRPVRALRYDESLELDAARDCWYVVYVEGTRRLPAPYCGRADAPPAFAVTNPFWIDADGDGEVRIKPW